jgi:LysM repeat protein
VTEIPPGATVGFCYRVQPGDTLYNLPEKFRVEMGIEVHPHHIDVANNLQPPGYIFVHQALFIPTQMGCGPNVYITRPDDTLASVADACHLPVSFLAQVNNISQAATLQEDIVLIIPIPPFPPSAQFLYPSSVFPGPY